MLGRTNRVFNRAEIYDIDPDVLSRIIKFETEQMEE